MHIEVKDGKVSVQISGDFDHQQLMELLLQLGEARSQIANEPPSLENTEVLVPAVQNPPYWTQITAGHSMLAFRHPAFGWVAALLPVNEAARLVGFLGNQINALTAAGTTASAVGESPANPAPDDTKGGGLLH
ncbi:hypothetical protein [Delftia tsuruhatensis]|uniref:hypothetical protein n=1 Tax=Delftia tsuruhatensis TaxID=180282 RepID=UPI0024482567|nr:hypothetical protein [Delftia tsuruhatensis]MDH1824606.1 hypothetical protein [Delftia tsuruhatensis]